MNWSVRPQVEFRFLIIESPENGFLVEFHLLIILISSQSLWLQPLRIKTIKCVRLILVHIIQFFFPLEIDQLNQLPIVNFPHLQLLPLLRHQLLYLMVDQNYRRFLMMELGQIGHLGFFFKDIGLLNRHQLLQFSLIVNSFGGLVFVFWFFLVLVHQHTLEILSILWLKDIVVSLHPVPNLVVQNYVSFLIVFNFIPIFVQIYLIPLCIVFLEGLPICIFLHHFPSLVQKNHISIWIFRHLQTFLIVSSVLARLWVDDHHKSIIIKQGHSSVEVPLNCITVFINKFEFAVFVLH